MLTGDKQGMIDHLPSHVYFSFILLDFFFSLSNFITKKTANIFFFISAAFFYPLMKRSDTAFLLLFLTPVKALFASLFPNETNRKQLEALIIQQNDQFRMRSILRSNIQLKHIFRFLERWKTAERPKRKVALRTVSS